MSNAGARGGGAVEPRRGAAVDPAADRTATGGVDASGTQASNADDAGAACRSPESDADRTITDRLLARFESPVVVESVELVRPRGPRSIGARLGLRPRGAAPHRDGDRLVVRVRSVDGCVGLAVCNAHVATFVELAHQFIFPHFVGRDARYIETHVDSVVHPAAADTTRRVYKYAGLPLWNLVAHVELAILDMLGRIAHAPVHRLLGDPLRDAAAVYVTRFNRDSAPEAEVADTGALLAKIGGGGVKFKIGRRLSNTPEQMRRDLALVALARRTLGDSAAIAVDANGSYTADEAIDLGRRLAEHNATFFEEPCHFEDTDATRRVADALDLPVAGGEQESSVLRWRRLLESRTFDVVQPDIYYCGGLCRAMRIARWSASLGLPCTPHNPHTMPLAAPALHLTALLTNPAPLHEYAASDDIRAGRVTIPTEPGLGHGLEPDDYR